MNIVDQAVEFAHIAHMGQYRNGDDYLRVPYIIHPLDVVRQLHCWGITAEKYEALWVAAICHDVVEDTNITIDKIAELWGSDVASIVSEMTFVEGIDCTKNDYLKSFVDKSLHSLVLKIADRMCNIADFMASNDTKDYAKKYYKKAKPLFDTYSARLDELREEFGDAIALDIGRSIATFSSVLGDVGINLPSAS